MKHSHNRLTVNLLAGLVFVYGLIMLADVLGIRLVGRSLQHANDLSLSISLVGAMSLIYLSTRLRRRKKTAFWVTLVVYAALFVADLVSVFIEHDLSDIDLLLHRIFIPVVVMLLLWLSRAAFTVRSDISSFRVALRASLLVLVITFAYGVSGFLVLDEHSFQREIGVSEAIHRTLDQIGLTTDDELQPKTKRAHLFLDSLSIISTASFAYAGLSLFRPLRAYYGTSNDDELIRRLIAQSSQDSEDYFKLWPQDKSYFFSADKQAGLAYKVRMGTALVVGDPFGKEATFDSLTDNFIEFCELNDWQPAFIHVSERYQELYERHGFALQKIGEEALIDLATFITDGTRSKYFRQIQNRFTKQGYYAEMLLPPHASTDLMRLRTISDAWLKLPGREERGFVLGYFTEAYMQQGAVMVLRDPSHQIQAFINEVPTFNKTDITFDLLRSTTDAPGNSNDFLMMEFVKYQYAAGYKKLNGGLCPLSGMDDVTTDRTVIDDALQFLYANGSWFYSFSGLRKFKEKYQPTWSHRYIAYRGGIRGFSRTLAALNAAMKVKIR